MGKKCSLHRSRMFLLYKKISEAPGQSSPCVSLARTGSRGHQQLTEGEQDSHDWLRPFTIHPLGLNTLSLKQNWGPFNKEVGGNGYGACLPHQGVQAFRARRKGENPGLHGHMAFLQGRGAMKSFYAPKKQMESARKSPGSLSRRACLQRFLWQSFEQDEVVKSCQIWKRGVTVATARAHSVVPRVENRMASLPNSVGGDAN